MDNALDGELRIVDLTPLEIDRTQSRAASFEVALPKDVRGRSSLTKLSNDPRTSTSLKSHQECTARVALVTDQLGIPRNEDCPCPRLSYLPLILAGYNYLEVDNVTVALCVAKPELSTAPICVVWWHDCVEEEL
jgi:hypothetical protein